MNRLLRSMIGAPLALLMLLSLMACGDDDMAGGKQNFTSKIQGTVYYRERIMLPPTAKIEIVLEDISVPDAPASVLATLVLDASSGPPYPFSIDYQAERINPRNTYALRATIHLEDKLIFTTMDYINPFSGNPVEVQVRQVPVADDFPG